MYHPTPGNSRAVRSPYQSTPCSRIGDPREELVARKRELLGPMKIMQLGPAFWGIGLSERAECAPGHAPRQMPIYASFFPVVGVAILAAGRGRRKARNIGAALALFLIVAIAQGCGGGDSKASASNTITVIGTSGSTAHTTQVTLFIH